MNEAPAPDAVCLSGKSLVTGVLDVGEGHQLYFEQCGDAKGLPVVFLHGGPGGGCSSRHRELFDLDRFRVTLFDQRGCGRSKPRGSLRANTSHALVELYLDRP